MKISYFDNAATTKVDDFTLELFLKIEKSYFANIDSTNGYSFECKQLYLDSKKKIIEILNLKNQELVFTHSASEANNLAINGFLKNKNGHIIISEIEHKSVLEVVKQFKNFDITYVKPINGIIKLEEIKKQLRADTIFVSVQFVNSETGAINEVHEIGRFLKELKICFHCDCVQAVGKTHVDFSCFSLATISLHKIHGLKNSGILIKNNKIKLEPLVFGGLQESNLISGTISLSSVVCAHYTIHSVYENFESNYKKIKFLNELFRKNFKYTINEVENSTNYIINCAINNVPSQTVVNVLNNFDIYISAQSACYKNKYSYVLESMNLDEDFLKSSFRISFSKNNEEFEVLLLCEKLNEIGEQYEKSNFS